MRFLGQTDETVIWLQQRLKDYDAFTKESCMFDHKRSCGQTDKAIGYELGDCRFESCQDQNVLFNKSIEIFQNNLILPH